MPDGQMASDDGIGPGQIWLIEQDAAAAIGAGDRDALTAANVILYDRTLASLVAEILPLGAYAEPLARDADDAASAISPRALQFAADGWSVVQLVAAASDWRRRLQHTTLRAPRRHDTLPVRVIASGAAGAAGHSRDGCACELPDLIEKFAADTTLRLVFGPLAQRAPTAHAAFTANGLAG